MYNIHYNAEVLCNDSLVIPPNCQIKSLGLNVIWSTKSSELVAPPSNTIRMGSCLAIEQKGSNIDLRC